MTESTSNDFDDDQQVALGVERAGEGLSEILDEIRDNNPQLLRVRAGTPMGIFFVSAVTNNSRNDDRRVGGILNPITDESVSSTPPEDIQ